LEIIWCDAKVDNIVVHNFNEEHHFAIIDFDRSYKFERKSLGPLVGTPGCTFSSFTLTPYEDFKKIFIIFVSLFNNE
jgi:hypothetical protein